MKFSFFRSSSRDYIPLQQFPTFTSAQSISELTSYCLRRRFLFFAVFTASLLSLFLFLKHTIDEAAFYDLDFEAVLSLQTSYLPFQIFPQVDPPKPPELQVVPEVPEWCRNAYFVDGSPCYAPHSPKLDFIWTWVNGSDPLLRQAKKLATSRYSPDDPYRPTQSSSEDRLYRDHDELRHSIRSVLANFRPYIGRLYLLTSDFAIPSTQPELSLSTSWRLGQFPQWLDLTRQTPTGWEAGNVELDIIHHAEIFNQYHSTVFNSLAIESQLGHVDGISDYFIYMNDDLFLTKPMSAATFYTPAYGIVLHYDTGLNIPPERPTPATEGEWRGMGESNYMLSQRFGSRYRPYVMHEAKVVSAAMLAELETIWPEAFARSASHSFRETAGPGSPSDINTMFLHAHFIVERAREALLWSWVVGRVGAVDDSWGAEEARRAWEEMGGWWTGEGGMELDVRAGWRRTLERERVEDTLRNSGLPEGLGPTSYVFSSLDGYAYMAYDSHIKRLTPDVPEGNLPWCRIKYDECFAGYDRASDVFKNIAFRKPGCGDCAINAMIKASGAFGISALLPPADREVLFSELEDDIPTKKAEPIAHLPLADRWEDGDFSLRGVMSTASEPNVREWTMQVLQRYRYVAAETPYMFERLYNPSQVREMLGQVDDNEGLALLCINDDVDTGDDEVASIFRAWQERHWYEPAAWEKR